MVSVVILNVVLLLQFGQPWNSRLALEGSFSLPSAPFMLGMEVDISSCLAPQHHSPFIEFGIRHKFWMRSRASNYHAMMGACTTSQLGIGGVASADDEWFNQICGWCKTASMASPRWGARGAIRASSRCSPHSGYSAGRTFVVLSCLGCESPATQYGPHPRVAILASGSGGQSWGKICRTC
jgi:hypothetical protein